jgi:hypothetical protein
VVFTGILCVCVVVKFASLWFRSLGEQSFTSSNMKSPVKSIHSIHAMFVASKLQPLQADFLHRLSLKKHLSQLSFCVNDRYVYNTGNVVTLGKITTRQ